MLDGHTLVLRLSRQGDGTQDEGGAAKRRKRSAPGAGSAAGQPKGAAGCKITVKNVAFEATRNEIRELFGSFGQVRCRRHARHHSS